MIYIYNMDYYNIIMEYQKIINLLGNTSNQPSKFRTKTWVEINVNQEEHTILTVKSNLKLQC